MLKSILSISVVYDGKIFGYGYEIENYYCKYLWICHDDVLPSFTASTKLAIPTASPPA